jgi:hypothetical protein
MVDRQVLHEVLLNLKIDPTDELLGRLLRSVEYIVLSHERLNLELLRGVDNFLRQLSELPHVRYGLYTGKVRGVAWVRLEEV